MAKKVGAQKDLKGDAAVKKATGHDRAYWFKKLDDAGAKKWDHKKTAAYVIDELKVEPWWGQGIAIDYEQERGLRKPGQRSDGTFSVTASKTVAAPAGELLDAVVQLLTVKFEQEPVGVSPTAKYPTARFKLDDGQKVVAMITPKNEAKATVSVEWGNLNSTTNLEAKKSEIRDWLGELG